MKESDETLNLTFEFETAIDPRSALYNDYMDHVRGARETLRMYYQLREEGYLQFGDASPWWKTFLARLLAEVESEEQATEGRQS